MVTNFKTKKERKKKMKRIISLVLGLFILSLSVVPNVYADSSMAGEGTKENPYVITTEAEFNMIRYNPTAYYSLQADIVLSDSYIPFEFSGSLVGQNVENPYSITVNISSKSSYTSPIGLFTVVKDVVLKNLTLKGKVNGYAYVGGFFGKIAEDSKSEVLENLINDAQIIGKGTYVGGIGAAASKNTEISKLMNKGYVKGSGYTGGIFASAYNIFACANNGVVISDGDYAGGIVAETKGKISESYNSGNVSAYGYAGGISGCVSGENTVIENCFNTGMISSTAVGINSCGGILGGIKRLPNVNSEITNCYNAGNVVDPCYINSQYIPYDKTNYIKVSNCYYKSASNKDIEGVSSFSEFTGLSEKLSSSFVYSDGIAVVNSVPYAEYTAPEYVADKEDTDASNPEKEEIQVIKEAELLKALGTIDTITDFDKKVTRGEFADYISRVFLYNIEFKKENAENVFYDVGPSYAYYDGIRVVSDLGIMSQDSYNRFYPDREITGEEAVTALIRALGYEVYAKANGGYPTGYLYEAKQIGLLKGLSNINSSVIDTMTAVKLLYNALFVNTVTTSGVDPENGKIIQVHQDSIYLDSVHSVYKYDAVLTDNGYSDSEIYYPETGTVEITDFRTGNKELIKADEGIASYLGQRMEVYVKDNNEAYLEAVYYIPSADAEVTTINGRDVSNLTVEGIFYETENSEQIKKLRFNSSKLPVVYINGKQTTGYDKIDFTSKNSLIYAIDNNLDSYIDYINIYKFDYEVIAGTLEDGKMIYPYSGSAYDMNLDTKKNVYTFIMGSEVKSISEISQGDIISVAKSDIIRDGARINYIAISKNKIAGDYDGKSDEYIIINGKEYYVSEMMKNTYKNYDSEIDWNSTINAYINIMGEIAYIYAGETTGRQYGFVLATGFTNEFDKRGIVKLLDMNGNVKTFYLAEKVKKDGSKVTDIDTFVDVDLATSNDSLIVYELNDKQEITNVEFAKIPSDNDAETLANFTLNKHVTSTSRYSGVTLGGVAANNTLVFVIPSDYKTDGSNCIVTKDYFARTEDYSNVKFYDVGQDGTAKVALYIPQNLAGDFNSKQEKSYVFKKLVKGYDETEGALNKIYYYDVGVERSILVSNDWIHVELNAGVRIASLNDLKPGDLFCYEKNSDGIVDKISVIYKSDDFLTSGDGVWYVGGEGTAHNWTLSVFEGTLQYKSNSMMTVRFQTADYNVEPFTYTTGKIGVYTVNKANGTIKLIDESHLHSSNFLTGEMGISAVFIASKNQLKEVIIYE